MKPSLQADVDKSDKSQDRSYVDGSNSKSCEFKVGDSVKVRNMICRDKWLFGTVIKRICPLRYLVRIGSRVRYCHLNHLVSAGTYIDDLNQPLNSGVTKQDLSQDTFSKASVKAATTLPKRPSDADGTADGSSTDTDISLIPSTSPMVTTQRQRTQTSTPSPITPPVLRQSARISKPPERYKPS